LYSLADSPLLTLYSLCFLSLSALPSMFVRHVPKRQGISIHLVAPTHHSLGPHYLCAGVDLDEWTQRQGDSMRLGGNGSAPAPTFRKMGVTDMQNEQIDKKYQTKASRVIATS
jgi:hypothetical protein